MLVLGTELGWEWGSQPRVQVSLWAGGSVVETNRVFIVGSGLSSEFSLVKSDRHAPFPSLAPKTSSHSFTSYVAEMVSPGMVVEAVLKITGLG